MTLVSGGTPINQWVTEAPCLPTGTPTNMLAPVSEAVPVTAANQLGPFLQLPDPASPISLVVNGRPFFAADPSPAFTVSGTAITWISTTWGVAPGDAVTGVYYTILLG